MEKEKLLKVLKHISDTYLKNKDYISAGQINRAIDVVEDFDGELPKENAINIDYNNMEDIKKLIVTELANDYGLESAIEQVENSQIVVDSVSNEINITYDNGVKGKFAILFPMTLIPILTE